MLAKKHHESRVWRPYIHAMSLVIDEQIGGLSSKEDTARHHSHSIS